MLLTIYTGKQRLKAAATGKDELPLDERTGIQTDKQQHTQSVNSHCPVCSDWRSSPPRGDHCELPPVCWTHRTAVWGIWAQTVKCCDAHPETQTHHVNFLDHTQKIFHSYCQSLKNDISLKAYVYFYLTSVLYQTEEYFTYSKVPALW